jgi:hypothetical protein
MPLSFPTSPFTLTSTPPQIICDTPTFSMIIVPFASPQTHLVKSTPTFTLYGLPNDVSLLAKNIESLESLWTQSPESLNQPMQSMEIEENFKA